MQVHDNAGGIGRTLGTLAGKAVAAVQGTSESVKEQVNPVFSQLQVKSSECFLCLNVVLHIVVGDVLESCVAFFQALSEDV